MARVSGEETLIKPSYSLDIKTLTLIIGLLSDSDLAGTQRSALSSAEGELEGEVNVMFRESYGRGSWPDYYSLHKHRP